MKNKEDLRIRKTKAILYKTYLDLISNKDYNQIKISDICKKANINRSTFYDHFKDKEELASSLLIDTKKELENEINSITNHNSLQNYLYNIIIKIQELLENNMIIKALKISNLDLIKNTISSIIYEKIKKELVKEKNNYIDPDTYATFYSEGLSSLLLKENIKLEEIKKLLQNKK